MHTSEPRETSLFACAGIALFRAAVQPLGDAAPTAPPFAPGDDQDSQLAYLRAAAEDSALCEAIAVSSPSLAGTLGRVRRGDRIKPKDIRSAVSALLRYRLRREGRATPFGLMAGVAEAEFAPSASVTWGADHRKAVQPDTGWLLDVVKRLEQQPDTLAHARVVRNDLCYLRGDRLVLPFVPARGGREPGGTGNAKEVSIRYTEPVRLVWESTQVPLPYGEVSGKIAAQYPDVPRETTAKLLCALVAHEMLLTDVRPPMDCADPLGYVLERLSRRDGAPRQEQDPAAPLFAVQRGLADFAAAPLGEGAPLWTAVTRQMRSLHDAEQLVQVDLGIDVDVRLPRAVATEVEQAAHGLWRCAAPGASRGHLRQFHTDFVERYGTEQMVPLKEVLDPDLGLGAPAGYLIPVSDRLPAPADTAPAPRDRLLQGLAQEALRTGTREVVLDEALIDELADGEGQGPPASFELLAHLLADSVTALDEGDFRCVVVGASQLAGSFSGRFASLLPRASQQFTDILREVPPGGDATLTGQLKFPTFRSRGGNVTRVPQWLERTLAVGVFADPSDRNVLRLDDLALAADLDRLFVVSLRDGRRITPGIPCMVASEWNMPNAARLLHELGTYDARVPFWNWGQAKSLAYLPRIRYGRTVLASARWHVKYTELTRPTPDFATWQTRFLRWKDRWGVPDRVLAGVADNRMPLDLSEPAHQELLRQQLRRHEDTVVEETPAGGEFGVGWLADRSTSAPTAGRTHEIAFTLTSREAPPRGPEAPVRGMDSTHGRTAYLPGEEWFYAKVYSSTDRQDELIAHQLPRLVEALPESVDRWFFVRYRDPDPHLRIRLHTRRADGAAPLLAAVCAWGRDLRRAGLSGRLVLDTYEPETRRYGGPDVMAAAEHAFCADSRAVMEQLAATLGTSDADRSLLAAANYADLVRRLLGAEEGESWIIANIDRTAHHSAFTERRDRAMALIDPTSGWSALRALGHGDAVLASWDRRGEDLRGYGDALRRSSAAGRLTTSLNGVVHSLLHMHHNRLAGIDREAEGKSYALLRGATRAHHQRGLVTR
ncbi:lantibiotic dehydratase [Streptomyces sp. NPDC053474]|uniref:lantibiotic dehydratase n=1 Tax=Streptomyces sp. NPDC053474 TaxID=3365704 RepID=UPI0037CDB2F4